MAQSQSCTKVGLRVMEIYYYSIIASYILVAVLNLWITTSFLNFWEMFVLLFLISVICCASDQMYVLDVWL